jgi:hypothetical protein
MPSLNGIRSLLIACFIPAYVFIALFAPTISVYQVKDWDHALHESIITGKSPRKHVVFYNVFIPEAPMTENAVRIVREQLINIKESYAYRTSKDLKVYFVTLGKEGVITDDFLNEVCGANLSCSLVQHLPQGMETGTLTQMHEFCVDNQDALVSYIHNKGSFHPKTENENWRPILTEAALSDMCISHLDDDQCNTCGLGFYASWTP